MQIATGGRQISDFRGYFSRLVVWGGPGQVGHATDCPTDSLPRPDLVAVVGLDFLAKGEEVQGHWFEISDYPILFDYYLGKWDSLLVLVLFLFCS